MNEKNMNCLQTIYSELIKALGSTNIFTHFNISKFACSKLFQNYPLAQQKLANFVSYRIKAKIN